MNAKITSICQTYIEPLEPVFSVCKVEDYTKVDMDQPFCFTGRTDEEKSLVCPVDRVPGNAIRREDGWRAFRICGELDFSLIGVLARISQILANNQIGIFAISTFNTDYILMKEANFEKALSVLKNAGVKIKSADETVSAEPIETEGSSVSDGGKIGRTNRMKIMVSACLLGENCKYNGGNNLNPELLGLLHGHEVIPVCPEVLGGLPTPRIPAEIVNGTVINREGISVDDAFRKGAKKAMEIAKQEKPDLIILQSRSPSCGAKEVYDGSFSGVRVPGQGVFAEMAIRAGYRVIDVEDESQWRLYGKS